MNSRHLPIEICEHLIDEVAADVVARGFIEWKLEHRTLAACALTCRTWRLRAQFFLRKYPWLDTETKLLRFAEACHGDRASHSTNSITTGIALDGLGDFNPLDFTRGIHVLFTATFPNLQALYCNNVCFLGSVSRRMFRIGLPFFAHLAILELASCQFESARALFDIVWACRNVASLTVANPHFQKEPPSAGECSRLSTICTHLQGCQALCYLHLDPEFSEEYFVGCMFGSSVTNLQICIDLGSHLLAFLASSFPALQFINVYGWPDKEGSPSPPSWIKAIAASRKAPSSLQTIRMQRNHNSDRNRCCEAIVGGVRDDPDMEVLSGVEEVRFAFDVCDTPERCARYIAAALPSMRGVLRFEYRQKWPEVWTEYWLQAPPTRT